MSEIERYHGPDGLGRLSPSQRVALGQEFRGGLEDLKATIRERERDDQKKRPRRRVRDIVRFPRRGGSQR